MLIGMALTFGTLLSAELIVAAPAGANVQTYLDALHKAGINRDQSEELEMGWEVCALRELGTDPEHVQDQAVQNSRTYPPDGITLDEAAQIVRIAGDELCNKRLSPKPVAPTSNHRNGNAADRPSFSAISVAGVHQLKPARRPEPATDRTKRP
jgi:hypothetical protein